MRPVDGAALASGEFDVIATAPGGRLELDGKPLETDEPFPDVFHARVNAAPGEHRIALVWETGRKEIRVFAGAGAPEDYAKFQEHPPVPGIECSQCHGISRRGRFRFTGGCLDCHAEGQFTDSHPHPPHVLEQCGLCHNAHGSTAAAHMTKSKEEACSICHSFVGAAEDGAAP